MRARRSQVCYFFRAFSHSRLKAEFEIVFPTWPSLENILPNFRLRYASARRADLVLLRHRTKWRTCLRSCSRHNSSIRMKTFVTIFGWSFCFVFQIAAGSLEGWTTVAPREEIRPQFQPTETGGKSGQGALVIRADERDGLHGWWQKIFSVTGGQHYHFSAWRRTEHVAVPRRAAVLVALRLAAALGRTSMSTFCYQPYVFQSPFSFL